MASDAVAMGRRLRNLHKGFKGVREAGQRYYALEPEAYAWVHATLLETYIAGHAHFGRPMRPDQIDRFYLEYKGLGRLIGVREKDLPPDTYAEFRRYFDRVCVEKLVRTASVDRVIDATQGDVPPPFPLPRSIWRAARIPARKALYIGGVGMLTPQLRDRFGLAWTGRDERQFQLLGRTSRSLTPVMPKPLRIVGPAQLKMRRRAFARGPLGPAAADRRTLELADAA